jgi:hypothetical protein
MTLPKKTVQAEIIREGMKLIWQPSGLLVDPIAIVGPNTVRVRAASGALYTVNVEKLETIPVPDEAGAAHAPE